MAIQIALLRGINVGPHKRIAMADLRGLLAELGYGDARTLVQSGNIVLTADVPPDRLARELEGEIAGRLGVQTSVVVRTHEELAAVVALDPLRDVADQHKLYQVSFLSAEPDRMTMQGVAAVDVAPERFVHAGREIYAWHPAGIQRSRLASLLTDKHLGVTATARNWNTVVKLLELADELEA
ncbi:MAG TPA: DUF1697 domain-containing protein [Solirubrobacteraceae bacterium]